MNSNNNFGKLSRREFLAGAGGVAGFVAVGSAGAEKTPVSSPAISQSAYDIQKLGKIDPQLIKYEETGSIAVDESPARIEVIPDARIRVTAEKKIIELNLSGKIENQYKLTDNPKSFKTASDGKIYVGYKGFIEVLDKTGSKLTEWKSFPETAWFTAIDEAGDFIFAADCGGRLVFKCHKDGKVIARYGENESGKTRGQFIVPSPYFDLEIGKDELLWIANPGKRLIEAYTFDGKLVKSWGKSSFAADGFCGCCNPSYFTIAPDGRFITSEKGLFRIKVYSADGEFEGVVGGMETFPDYYKNITPDVAPMDVAVDAEGKIYVADSLSKKIRIFRKKA
ncbi:MAG: hypothetical protein N2487_00720 [Verrucomicrobiae bacterium]|nr:hypothetical protein [Verrucomicrobiae bacterium]